MISHITNTLTARAEVAGDLYDGMVPSLAGNLIFTIIFGTLFVSQMALSIIFRQWWFLITFFCGLTLEIFGCLGRFLSHYNVTDQAPFLMQSICLTLAPPFIMAGIYYLLAKLATIYGRQYSVLSPQRYSYIFIGGDFLSIVVQGAGGAMAATGSKNPSQSKMGTDIMLVGLAIQIGIMSIFFFFMFHFTVKSKRAERRFQKQLSTFGLTMESVGQTSVPDPFDPRFTELRARKRVRYYPYVVVLGTMFVYIRSVYRVAEFAQGWGGHMMVTEGYFFVLDALMMTLGIGCLTVWHPGIAFGATHIPVKPKGRINGKASDLELREMMSEDAKTADDIEIFGGHPDHPVYRHGVPERSRFYV